jgi:protein SCO1/2
MRAIFATLLLALSAAALSGCGGGAEAPKFRLTDVSGAGFGKELNLTDHHGKPRTLADFRGKVVTVFFGFTHCPDACPTTMVEMAQVAKELGPDAEKLQVLFVTVDPERDTQKVLSQYVPSFHPGFLGLYGDAEATARAAKEFKVYFNKQPPKGGGAGGSYSVDHSAGTFILDRQGRLRLFAQYGTGAEAILHDVRVLMRSS